MNSFNSYPDILNTDDVCEILNISKPHCLKLLNAHAIKGFKVTDQSKVWKITKPAIIQFLLGNSTPVRTH